MAKKINNNKNVESTKKKVQNDKKEIQKKEVLEDKNSNIKIHENKFIKKHLLKNMHFKGYQIIIFSLILIFVTVVLTVFTTKSFSNSNQGNKEKKYSNNDNYLSEFEEVYNLINDSYYEATDRKKMVDGAINGMLESLGDPHTSYFSKEETESFNEVMNGSYEGIGAEISINSDNKIIVHSVFKNSPADKAGLKFNDIILEVNGKSTEGITTTETVALIKDASKPVANIIIERNGERLEFNIKKEIVIIESVESDIYEKNGKKIGYILVNNFANNTFSQFNEHLVDLEKKGIEGLVIDVRGNSGGYLHSVTNMLDLFLERGKVIYQIKDRSNTTVYKANTKESRTYNIAVLINKASASASEILAVSLKESYGALVIGTDSYGKGTVQVTKDLSGGAMIKYTIQKWLSPDGNWINEVGVKPTTEVELSEDYLNNPTIENDNQLQTALDEVSKR